MFNKHLKVLYFFFLCAKVLWKAGGPEAAVGHPCARRPGAGWGAAAHGVPQGTLGAPLVHRGCRQLSGPHVLYASLYPK